MGKVLALQLVVKHRKPLQAADSVKAIVAHGLEGDIHSKRVSTKRQVHVLDIRVLESVGLKPGDLRDQVTVDFPDLTQLPEGKLLAIGEAVFELTMPCPVCDHVADLVGHPDPDGLIQSLQGKSGMLARVVHTTREGHIKVGDCVSIYTGDTSEFAIGSSTVP